MQQERKADVFTHFFADKTITAAFAETSHVDVHIKVGRLSLILADGPVSWPRKPQQPEGHAAGQKNEEAPL